MIIAIIQARMGATRLPGKVLLPLPMGNKEGKTVLSQVCRRLSQVKSVDKIVVATTVNPADDPVANWVKSQPYSLFRGDESDVLARYYHAAKENNAHTVIRVTADCPCLDPDVIATLVEVYKASEADYLSNTQQRTFPHGLDAEIFSFCALEKAYNEATKPFEREHVTPYLYKSGKFSCENYASSLYQTGDETIRVTLDTPQDYAVIGALYDLLGESFSGSALREAFDKYKWLRMINESIIQKKVYDTENDEIQDAVRFLKRQDMPGAAAILSRITE